VQKKSRLAISSPDEFLVTIAGEITLTLQSREIAHNYQQVKSLLSISVYHDVERTVCVSLRTFNTLYIFKFLLLLWSS